MGSREYSRGGSLGEGGRSRARLLAASVVMAVAVAVVPRDDEHGPADVCGDRAALLADRPAEIGVVRHVRLLSGRAARPFSPRRMVMSSSRSHSSSGSPLLRGGLPRQRHAHLTRRTAALTRPGAMQAAQMSRTRIRKA